MRSIVSALGLALAGLALYLLLWPIPIDPVAVTPPAQPSLTGAYAPNTRLRAVEHLSLGGAAGPEDVTFDREGRIYTGVADGRVLRLQPDGSDPRTFARTGARPLGLRFDGQGNLIVAGSDRGLLSVSPAGEVAVLTTGLGGSPFKLVDAVAIASDGTIYFTDASRFPDDLHMLDFYEHRPHGRVLAYDPRTGRTRLVLDGLYFANGIALSPDESFLLVNETSASRVRRYWLAGPRQGQDEVLIENLPGFPDNIASNGRGTFWVGLVRGPSARRMSDAVLPYPFLRRVAVLLHFNPAADRHAWVLGLDAEGQVVRNLQDPAGQSYAGITTAAERDGMLYLGSLDEQAIGRLPLDN